MGWLRVCAISIVVLHCQGETVTTPEQALANARAAQQQGDYPTAERYFRLALKSQPKSAELWNGLGVVLNRQEHYDDAAEAFRAALRLHPFEGVELNLGIALFRGGKLAEAAQIFEGLPRLEQAQELLTLTYLGLERYDRALPLLQKLAPVSVDPTLHLALAR